VDALPGDASVLAEVRSGDLRGVLADMLNYSTNVTAEAVGLAASVARGPIPASLPASADAMSAWLAAGIGSRKPDFVDHSGLGDRSRITPHDMVRALVELGPGAGLDGILKDIGMRDERFRAVQDYPAEIVAKTGTLNFVSGLAGYVTPMQGRRLAFAIFASDMPRREGIPRAQREAPEGAAGWARRARVMQYRLLDRWTLIHGDLPPEEFRRRPKRRPESLACTEC
jgi:D-alanyl-D-alanine carboxypeptidase/D-alanyl-D-alanine-endopeptidase (penicillin-binding protein 4)